MEIRLTKAQKNGLKALFVPYCRHVRQSYDGKTRICGLKELKERCEYSNWTTWADCPTDCPHHMMMTKVTCNPEQCALAENFVKEVRMVLNERTQDGGGDIPQTADAEPRTPSLF